ncbi:MAG: signal peptidase I [Candidatus Westeberhardia cardiocondylae]|nr:signal peptidase I [Candidatus Westeberhardia cardiocondylae]
MVGFCFLFGMLFIVFMLFFCMQKIQKILYFVFFYLYSKIKKRSFFFKQNSFFIFKRLSQLWLVQTCTLFFSVLFWVFIFRSFFFEPFHIPSGSMMPTLLAGDFILVNKFSYNIKNPITKKIIINVSVPKRGDVVVFKNPLNPKLYYVKRIVGLPGDKVKYDVYKKQLTIRYNYVYKDKKYSKTFPMFYSDIIPSDFIKIFCSNDTNNFINIPCDSMLESNFPSIRLMQCKEYMGDIFHYIFIIPGYQDFCHMYYKQPGTLSAEWIVPNGKYFMMGDNRDNSSDSRYFGFVPKENLVGKVSMIWLSFDKQNKNFPFYVRFKRIGLVF